MRNMLLSMYESLVGHSRGLLWIRSELASISVLSGILEVFYGIFFVERLDNVICNKKIN
jgi:hypothetical protein